MNIRSEMLKIVTFHDVFGVPVTLEEVWGEVESRKSPPKADQPQAEKVRRQEGTEAERQEEYSLRNIFNTLEQMVIENLLEKEEVFYCLKGRREIIGQRKIRYPISLRRMIRAKRWIRIFAHLPFIRKIFVAGTVADQNAKHDSDIDVVVETGKVRLWTARFFLNALLTVLNKRPRPGKTRDTFCTSFFYDEVFDPQSIMPEDLVFQKWIKSRVIKSEGQKVRKPMVQKVFEGIISIIPEAVFRWVQIHILMPRALREANGKDGELDVYFENRVAKFHLNNRRKEFNAEFQKRLSELNLT